MAFSDLEYFEKQKKFLWCVIFFPLICYVLVDRKEKENHRLKLIALCHRHGHVPLKTPVVVFLISYSSFLSHSSCSYSVLFDAYLFAYLVERFIDRAKVNESWKFVFMFKNAIKQSIATKAIHKMQVPRGVRTRDLQINNLTL